MNARVKPINSRQKGAAAEREFARLIHAQLGVELRRNLEQSRRGGHDLMVVGTDPVSVELDRYAIECKRYREITPAMLVGFWRQAEEQAVRATRVPALAFREDRRDWRLLLPLYVLSGDVFQPWPGVQWTAEISVEAFACLVRERAGTDHQHQGEA